MKKRVKIYLNDYWDNCYDELHKPPGERKGYMGYP
jgi:hypothetical protein